MGCFSQTLPVIIYILLIILIVVSIVVLIRSFITLQKFDKLIENANSKIDSLQNLCNIIDSASDTFAMVSDKIVGLVVGGISKIFNKKKEDDRDE